MRIIDGDKGIVLDCAKIQHKTRLQGIDVTEKGRPFGKRDRYGRIVGKVLAGRKRANLEQVRAGLAWHVRKCIMEQTLEDRLLCAEAEQDAKREM